MRPSVLYSVEFTNTCYDVVSSMQQLSQKLPHGLVMPCNVQSFHLLRQASNQDVPGRVLHAA